MIDILIRAPFLDLWEETYAAKCPSVAGNNGFKKNSDYRWICTMTGPITTLVEDKLYALHNPYELNGFVSSHPVAARGYAPQNCYLLKEGDRALLLDTGFSAHEASLLSQLDSLIDGSIALTVFPATIGEFVSICNTRPVVDRFNVDIVYGLIGSPTAWTDFRPEYSPYGGPVGHGAMSEVGEGHVRSVDEIPWARSAGRSLEVFQPPLRLLPSHWCYDEETGALFTGDSFNHVWRSTADGPWVVAPEEPSPSFEQVYEFLTKSRYWWLPGAETGELSDALREAFEQREVKIIAPRFGCVISDPETIEMHYQLLQSALRASPERASTSVLAGAEAMGGR